MKILRNKKRGIRILKGFFFLLTFNFILFTLHSVANASVLTRPANNLGLVGYWSFEDGSGSSTTDFSGNGNTGTFVGGVTWLNGKRGKAIRSPEGNAYVNVGNGTSLRLASDTATLSAWVKLDTLGVVHEIVNKIGGSDTYSYGMEVRTDNKVYCRFSTDGTAPADNASSITLVADTWYHIGCVYDGANQYTYINGVENASTSLTGNIFNASGTDVYLHAYEFGFQSSNYLHGSSDEVRIYNRALSATEILALYNTGSARITKPNNLGLVGYWSFEDGSGTSTTDFSGNGNTGTLSGDTSWINGKRGKALTFDGTGDYVNIPDTAALRPGTGAFTMAYWFNAPNVNQVAAIVAKRDPGGSANQIQTGVGAIIGLNSSSSKKVYIFTYDANQVSYYTTNDVVDGNWHHVAAIRRSSGAPLIYIDGVSVSLTSDADTGVGDIDNTDPWRIANSNSAVYFNGQVDDVRLYNRELSAAEVTSLYNSGSAVLNTSRAVVPTSSLVLWHTFDGPYLNTTTSTDRSGQGNNGTLAGATGAQNKPQVAIGKTGQALNFDGTDDYVGVSSFSQVLLPVTFSAWVYADSLSSFDGILFSRGSNTSGVMLNEGATRLGYTWNDVAGTYNWNGGPLLPTGKWVLAVVTIDATQAVAYACYDGSCNSGVNTLAHATSTINDVKIGTDDYGSRDFAGKIDDVRIYSTALSAAEVKQLYDAGK